MKWIRINRPMSGVLSMLALMAWTTVSEAAWFDQDWNYRKAIQIQASQVVGDQADFAVMFRATDADLANSAQADGDDIVFALEDGTKLDHELERYDGNTGELVAWIRIPTLLASANTNLFLYYGNPSAGNQEEAFDTWDDDFQMVHHLEEPGGDGTDLFDSTRNGHDGEVFGRGNNVPTYLSGGIANGARSHTGQLSPGNSPDSLVGFSDFGDPGLSSSFTAEAWARVSANQSGNDHHPIFWKGNVIGWGANYFFRIAVRQNNGITWGVTCGNTEAWFDGGSASTGWAHYAISFDGTTTRAYINGQQVASDNDCAGRSLNVTSQPYRSGYGIVQGNGETVLNGDVDEVRISSRARSGGWLRTHYNNLSDPGTFFVIGNEETGGFCSTVTALFCDDFERGSLGPDWSVVTASGGNAGISAQTSKSPVRSLYTSSGFAEVTLAPLDLSGLTSGTVAYWWRRGDDAFSEDPDGGEDLRVEYLDDAGNWELIDRYPGNGTTGESGDVVFTLPPDAFHNNFRMRFVQESGNTGNFDFWHIDDVVIDGSSSPLTCAGDTFGTGTLSPDDWITNVSSGSFTPGIVNGRLRMTEASGNQATAATFQNLIPGADNYVRLEFDYFAYGGNGADGLTVVLSDASVTPQPGSFGGSLGYAQRNNGDPGFAGGWLGIGLDEFGNFSNATEGRVGGIGFVRDAVAIRGAAQSNYQYLGGTGSLSPGIDQPGNNPTPHRYRIIVDSRGGVGPIVSVERDVSGTGNNFQQLVQLDLSSFPDQPATPQNFYLSLTGSTGGSTNIHELDNLQLCAEKLNPVGKLVDHFEFVHDGTALTCQPETVTVRACENADCSVLFTDPVDVTLSPSGWVGGDSFTFSGGQATRQLQNTTAGTATLAIASSDPSTKAFTQTLCDNGSGNVTAAACELPFFDAGLAFDIPDLTSHQPANSVQISAVRRDNQTGACVPAFENVQREVSFWSTYVDPGPNGRPESRPVIVENTAVGSGQANATPIDLQFGPGGIAEVDVVYPDAGLLNLDALYLGSAATDDDGLQMPGADSFVSVPAGFCVTSAGDCPAGDSTCPAFRKAGQPFDLSITAVGWQQNGDSDLCQGNPVTPNFRLLDIPLSATLIQPAGGASGSVTPVSYSHTRSASAVETVSTEMSEVGVFQFEVSPRPGSYLGRDVPDGRSAPIGRFYPDRFRVSVDPGEFEAQCTTGSPFVYTGQEFEWLVTPSLTIEPLSARGTRTLNYTFSGFQKLVASDIDRSYPLADSSAVDQAGGPMALIPTEVGGSLSAPVSVLGNGLMRYDFSASDSFAYSKTSASLIAPFTPQLEFAITSVIDSDGVDASAAPYLFTPAAVFDVRFGRFLLENVYGPENIASLEMPFRLEYWDGARFVTHADDSCTAWSTSDLTNSANHHSIDSSAPSSGVFSMGQAAPLALVPDGTRGTDTLVWNVDSWLEFDWNDDGVLEDPTGLATFGVYRGHDRVIHWQER
ncbi:DUF2341 domain-containing protein [Marinobacter sp.]|uniref:DUF2341 domain-containing protein n=1 Tax=Marinobacter sp. TaxID=50741 RepID=UPI003564AF75